MVNKIGIIIQARMGSSRLPGKIAKRLPYRGEFSVLEHIILRAKSIHPDYLVAVATSEHSDNDWVETITQKHQVVCFRGDEEDVLSRYYTLATQHQLDHVVRLTGDNPCIDPYYIKVAIQKHLEQNIDYTYTQGLPLGMNVEVISFTALKASNKLGGTPPDREHVTHYVRQNSDKFTLQFINVLSEKQDFDNYRLTLDTSQDYALMCLLYERLYPLNHLFGFREIIDLLEKEPWVLTINQQVIQKQAYNSFEDEKMAAVSLLEKNGFTYTAQYLLND
ncbi:hypothetical protein BKI52_21060 [marine bacterium AO1-C]|nr:hypothetical protein BKI52_21060 [marine bacterium AO1-C]